MHRKLKTKKSNVFLHANVTIAGLSKLLPELTGTHRTLKLPAISPNYPDFLTSGNWRQLARYCHLFHLGLHEKAWPTHRRREHRLTAMASCSQPFFLNPIRGQVRLISGASEVEFQLCTCQLFLWLKQYDTRFMAAGMKQIRKASACKAMMTRSITERSESAQEKTVFKCCLAYPEPYNRFTCPPSWKTLNPIQSACHLPSFSISPSKSQL